MGQELERVCMVERGTERRPRCRREEQDDLLWGARRGEPQTVMGFTWGEKWSHGEILALE